MKRVTKRLSNGSGVPEWRVATETTDHPPIRTTAAPPNLHALRRSRQQNFPFRLRILRLRSIQTVLVLIQRDCEVSEWHVRRNAFEPQIQVICWF